MRRLRDDEEEADPSLARLTELVKKTAPLERSASRQASVRFALNEQRRPAPRMVLRPAMVLALLGLAGIVSAMVGRAWFRERPPSHSESTSPAAPKGVAAPATEPATAQAEAPPAPIEVAEAPAPSVRVRTPAQSASHEAELVARAVKVLRSDRNPKRAQALFLSYLRAYPNGILVEEAYALAIEAASARADHVGAKRLGAGYLKKYPHGRFVVAAQKAAAQKAIRD